MSESVTEACMAGLAAPGHLGMRGRSENSGVPLVQ